VARRRKHVWYERWQIIPRHHHSGSRLTKGVACEAGRISEPHNANAIIVEIVNRYLSKIFDSTVQSFHLVVVYNSARVRSPVTPEADHAQRRVVTPVNHETHHRRLSTFLSGCHSPGIVYFLVWLGDTSGLVVSVKMPCNWACTFPQVRPCAKLGEY